MEQSTLGKMFLSIGTTLLGTGFHPSVHTHARLSLWVRLLPRNLRELQEILKIRHPLNV